MATGISFTEVPPQQSHANLRKPTPKLELFVERTSNIGRKLLKGKTKTSHCHETQQISLPNYVKNTVEVLKLQEHQNHPAGLLKFLIQWVSARICISNNFPSQAACLLKCFENHTARCYGNQICYNSSFVTNQLHSFEQISKSRVCLSLLLLRNYNQRISSKFQHFLVLCNTNSPRLAHEIAGILRARRKTPVPETSNELHKQLKITYTHTYTPTHIHTQRQQISLCCCQKLRKAVLTQYGQVVKITPFLFLESHAYKRKKKSHSMR